MESWIEMCLIMLISILRLLVAYTLLQIIDGVTHRDEVAHPQSLRIQVKFQDNVSVQDHQQDLMIIFQFFHPKRARVWREPLKAQARGCTTPINQKCIYSFTFPRRSVDMTPSGTAGIALLLAWLLGPAHACTCRLLAGGCHVPRCWAFHPKLPCRLGCH